MAMTGDQFGRFRAAIPYTVATPRPAVDAAGALTHVGDGKPCLARSDHTAWHWIPLGNAIG